VKERRAVLLAAALFVVSIAVAVYFWPKSMGATKTHKLNVMNDTRQPISIDAYVLTVGSSQKGFRAEASIQEMIDIDIPLPIIGQHLVLVVATTVSKDSRIPQKMGIKLVTLPPLTEPVDSEENIFEGILGILFDREDMVEFCPQGGLDGTKLREVRRDLLKKALESLENLEPL